MAFCTNCGAQIDGAAKFCTNCGAAQQPAQALPQQQYPQPPMQNPGFDPCAGSYEVDANDIKSNKGKAILSYFGLLVLIPLFMAKESKYARFHANQGLTLLIANASIFLISFLSNFVTFLSFVSSICSLFVFVLAIIGIVNAASGKMKPLPIVGKIQILK